MKKNEKQLTRCPVCGRKPRLVEIKNDPYCRHVFIRKCKGHRCTNPFPLAEEATEAWNLDRKDDEYTYGVTKFEFGIKEGRDVFCPADGWFKSETAARRHIKELIEADEAFDRAPPKRTVVVRAVSEWVDAEEEG